ncbi:MAG: PHP domain-containing protein [Lutispora sp.]|nr:PHP domain-containing protein [Lutispora sp.]MEA4962476.1 PHP domain-containing protein [Lutispora sp.]
MIKLFADYHTHTIYSHGTGTIMDNVTAAREKGLKEIAITDHGFRHFSFGVKRENIKKMRAEIDEINEKYKDFKVLLGMECNIISRDGHIDLDDEAMRYMDIVLLGYHMMVVLKGIPSFVNLYGKNYISRINKAMAEEMRQSNTDIMINAIKKYKVNIITHPGARISMDTGRLAEAAAKVGTALEINSKSNIMTVDYLRVAAGHGVKFVINSDAHTPQDVGNFRNAAELAESAGLTGAQIINAYDS